MEKSVNYLKEQARAYDPVLRQVLQDIEVFIPEEMSRLFSFPASQVRYRRDNAVFMDMIASVGYMRQYEKEVKTHEYDSKDRIRYVDCDVRDYEIAYHAFIEMMKEDQTFDAYEELEEITTPEVMKEQLDVRSSKSKRASE